MRGTGDPMNFDIGYGIQVNEGSSLNREWVIVNDKRLPASLTSFDSETRIDDRNWIFDIDYSVEISEPIVAIEVRFIPFDIWGDDYRTLSATDIQDLGAGAHTLSGEWRISESDAVHHFAMLGYVAQVKLASGAVIRADVDAVVDEARGFSEDFSSGDLSPED
jgi:hypothetical protein